MRKTAYLGLATLATLSILLLAMSSPVLASAKPGIPGVLLTGKWVDGYGNKFILVAVGGKVFGLMITPDCGLWIVNGNYTGSSFALMLNNLPPIEEGCPEWIIYYGTLESFSTASIYWEDSTGMAGGTTMTRGWA